jgi:hypothetical protein
LYSESYSILSQELLKIQIFYSMGSSGFWPRNLLVKHTTEKHFTVSDDENMNGDRYNYVHSATNGDRYNYVHSVTNGDRYNYVHSATNGDRYNYVHSVTNCDRYNYVHSVTNGDRYNYVHSATNCDRYNYCYIVKLPELQYRNKRESGLR